jgi:hypothetical protein
MSPRSVPGQRSSRSQVGQFSAEPRTVNFQKPLIAATFGRVHESECLLRRQAVHDAWPNVSELLRRGRPITDESELPPPHRD